MDRIQLVKCINTFSSKQPINPGTIVAVELCGADSPITGKKLPRSGIVGKACANPRRGLITSRLDYREN